MLTAHFQDREIAQTQDKGGKVRDKVFSVKRMYCKKCGQELPEHAKFCKRCGTPVDENSKRNYCEESEIFQCKCSSAIEKPQTKKISRKKIAFLGVIGVCAVIGTIAFVSKHSLDGKEEILMSGDAENTTEYAKSTELNISEENLFESEKDIQIQDKVAKESVAKEAVAEETMAEETIDEISLEEKQMPVCIDIEGEIIQIRESYNAIVSSIASNAYEKLDLENGISAYYDQGNLKSVVISKGVGGVPYSRYYYYDDTQVFFAYFEGSDAHRFYFSDESMIRWRYSSNAARSQEAINHDLEKSEEYCSWEDRVLAEGRSFKTESLQENSDE